jgi:hypothetical protein
MGTGGAAWGWVGALRTSQIESNSNKLNMNMGM